jgi:hypothetical protein
VTLSATAARILAWWELGCVSSQCVTDWADGLIAGAERVTDLPLWLLELSIRGPDRFRDGFEPGFPRPARLTYPERFRATVEACDPADDQAIRNFAVWCANNAMGEKLDLEEVRLGYLIEHAFRVFRPRCHDIADVLGDGAVPANQRA